MTTTPIEQVPAACAALWAPYGVTKVPPANLTDSTPVPPTVVNGTNGAVSDADARAWALAANRAAVWLRWSEANDQYDFTTKIEGSLVVNATIAQLLRSGVLVSDPDCDLFANRYSLYSMSAEGANFFAAFGEATKDAYVFAERYPGPCALTAHYPDGHTTTLFPSPSTVQSIVAGAVRHDEVLGDIWYIDSAGFCNSRGAPTSWCLP